ncbi:uncharacterized protein LOC125556757 isoform X1 [Nematostella vectensis]|nr:uncharacterized protein LOC125556757 isoform X1 [Nematostella vectensis]
MEAALRFWMPNFGHVGPYSEQVKRDHDGKIVDIIPKGNPMEDAGVKTLICSLNKRKRRPSRRDMRAGMKPYEAKKAPPFYLEDMLKMTEYCLKTVEELICRYGPILLTLRCALLWHSFRGCCFLMTKALFEKPYTTHSIRRSAARWAARCGADDSTIKRAGRW